MPPALYRRLSLYRQASRRSAAPITKLAFEFLILTAVLTTWARKARWDEVDWQAKTWTIPGYEFATGRRMKIEREHVVPLSARRLPFRRHQFLAKRFEFMETWAGFACPAATVDSISGA